MTAIEVSGLSKRYGAAKALDEVSLALAPGAVYGLLGPNGSGKSTLLRVLATLERPTAGRVLVLGQDVVSAPRAVRRSLGFVPDGFAPYRGLSVAEHLDFFADCYGLRRRERLAAVDTMLQLVDLELWRNKPASGLSRGLRQRLALATALVHNPEILLMDEPLAGVDAAGRSEMLEVLRELRAMGKTIVLSSHGLEDVSRLCDAVVLLQKGHLLAFGTMDEVFADEAPPERLIRVEVAAGFETARTILRQVTQARELAVEGGRLTFAFAGDSHTLPSVLERLVSAGVQISEFRMDGPAIEDTLARALRELEI